MAAGITGSMVFTNNLLGKIPLLCTWRLVPGPHIWHIWKQGIKVSVMICLYGNIITSTIHHSISVTELNAALEAVEKQSNLMWTGTSYTRLSATGLVLSLELRELF